MKRLLFTFPYLRVFDTILHIKDYHISRFFSGWSPLRIFRLPHISVDSVYFDNVYFFDDDGAMEFFYTPVPCGHCELCRNKVKSSYIQKAQFEFLSTGVTPLFVTFTINGYHYKQISENYIRVFQLLFKRLRKNLHLLGYDGNRIKYLLCPEYGEKSHRLHFHAIIFGFPVLSQFTYANQISTIYFFYYLWRDNGVGRSAMSFSQYKQVFSLVFNRPPNYDPSSFGFVTVKWSDNAGITAGYITKYVIKGSCRFLQSVNLGLSYILPYRDALLSSLDNSLIFSFGGSVRKVTLCSYYVNKLFPSRSRVLPSGFISHFYNMFSGIEKILQSRCYSDVSKKSYLFIRQCLCDKFDFMPVRDVFVTDFPSIMESELLQSYVGECDFINSLHDSILYLDSKFVTGAMLDMAHRERSMYFNKFKNINNLTNKLSSIKKNQSLVNQSIKLI